MTPDPDAVDPAGPAHRLLLTGPELTDLVRRAGVRLPPPFALDDLPAEASDEPIHPSVAANLAVLARPEVTVRTEASLRGGRSRAVFAVAGPLGASLFALADGAVELSLFPAVALGRELVRAVPDESAGTDAAARIFASLSSAEAASVPAPQPPPAGRIDWAALADFEASRALGGAPAMTAAEAELAADTAGRTHGNVNCLIFGRVGAGAAVAVGQVVWIATDAGWVGLVPAVDPDGRRVVELRPVHRADLGTWLAPYLAQILDSRGSDHAGD